MRLNLTGLHARIELKRNIRSLAAALLCLSIPISAMGSVSAVTVPNQQGGFTLGGDFLYLTPTSGFLAYSPIMPGTLPLSRIHSVKPVFYPGFDIMAKYRLPNTGNSVYAIWTHLSNTNDTDSFVDPTLHFVVPSSTSDINATHSATVKFKYDAVDLAADQRLNLGDLFQFRVFSGLRWATLEHDKNVKDHSDALGVTAVGVPFTAISTDQLNQTSDFKGLGPQFGLEGSYCLGYGFDVDANLTASLLVGQINSNTVEEFDLVRTVGSAAPQTFVTIIQFNGPKKWRAVPAIDANLGLGYTYVFNNACHSALKAQIGYKVINYFGVVDFINPSGNSGSPNTSNLSFAGPYFGLNINL